MKIRLQFPFTSIFIVVMMSEPSFVSSVSTMKERNVAEAAASSGVVFHYRPESTAYTMNFEEAKKACEDVGARIASVDQLQEANKNGLHQCDPGWVSDQTIKYSTTEPNACKNGFNTVGVQEFRNTSASRRSDVFCFASDSNGMIILSRDAGGLSYEDASQRCQSMLADLATPGQLSYAWSKGLDECRPGWLKDGSIRFVNKISTAICAGGTLGAIYSASYESAFPEKHYRFAAYCFRGKRLHIDGEKGVKSGMNIFYSGDASVSSGQVTFYQWFTGPELVPFKDANAKCKEIGAELASPEQLMEANKNGFHQCKYGWVKGGHAQRSVGILGCENDSGTGVGVRTMELPSANVYCYIGPLTGNVFFIDGKFIYNQGINECKKKGGAMATPAQLSAAWKKGFNECRHGWVTNKCLRFVERITTNSCGGGEDGADATYLASYYVGFSFGNSLHGVYCHAE